MPLEITVRSLGIWIEVLARVVVVKVTFVQSAATEARRLALARHGDFEIQRITLARARRHHRGNQHQRRIRRCQDVFHILKSALAQIRLEQGSVAARRSAAPGSGQIDNQAYSAHRDRLRVRDRAEVADRLDHVLLVAVGVVLSLEPSLRVVSTPDGSDQKGAEYPEALVHGFFLAYRATRPGRQTVRSAWFLDQRVLVKDADDRKCLVKCQERNGRTSVGTRRAG